MSEIRDSGKADSPVPSVPARPFQRLFSWRVMSRWLFVLACLATLTGLLYAVENWRGKRAWEKCRRDLEARSEVLDWSAFIRGVVREEVLGRCFPGRAIQVARDQCTFQPCAAAGC